MKLLVTGGAGFIGSNFIHYWLSNHPDDEIVNFDVLTYAGNLENLVDVTHNPRYRFIKGDIRDSKAVESALEGVDTIVHFAAESHVDRSIMDPEAFVTTNVYGTYVLLEAAKKRMIRFHHVSTDEVYGTLPLDSKEKFTENTAYKPNSPYSASKAGSDHLVRAYFTTFAVPVTISNTSNNYGPYQFPEKLIPLAVTNLLDDKEVPIYGEGNQVRDWLFVEDHCRAIDLILTKGELGETYLIGGMTDDLTNLNVVTKLTEILDKPQSLITFVKDRPGHDVRYAVDWNKAKNKLSYEPRYSFDENLKRTVEWYQAHEEWWRRIKSGEYKNYYQKQYQQD